jgi:hypothetical protein
MTDEVTASTAAPETVASTPAAQPAAQPTAQPATDDAGKTPAAAEPAKRELERSPRGAVERAIAKLNGEPARDTAGRFMGKQGEPQQATAPQAKAPAATEAKPAAEQPAKAADAFHEAPSRFSADAKAAWAALPDAVKAETHRALRELEGGITKYKADAEAFESVRKFDELAKQSGTTMAAAMENYVGIEQLLAKDVVAGFGAIADNLGYDLVKIARHIVKSTGGLPAEGEDGSEPDGGQQDDPRIAALQNKIAALEGQLTGISGHVQSQQHEATVAQVEAFAKRPENARWGELENDILDILKGKGPYSVPANVQGIARVAEAYKLASLIKPAPAAPVIAAPAAPNPDPAAQTRKASLSVTGAPGNGSDPARKPASSIRNARAAVG